MVSVSSLLRACILVGYLSVRVRSQAPQIVEDIFTEVKRIGETGYLNCTVSRQGLNKVEWHQVDQQNINVISSNTKILALNPIEKGKYKYEIIKQVRPNDTITYTLVINRLREFDNGRYLCSIPIQGQPQSQWPKKYGYLYVQFPPTIIVSQTSNTLQRQQGQDVTLTCNANGNPTPNITWIRADGMPLPNGKFRHRGHNLTITNITKEDRGTYRCVADNNVVPPDDHDVELVVYFKPEAEAVQDTVGQAQNRRFDALLECRINGMPEPNLKWYMVTNRGEVKLSDNEKYHLNQLLSHGTSMQIGEVRYTLKILNVQANDYTTYYCEGENAFGSSRASIRLYETSECQGPDCPSVCITCKADVENITDTTAIVLLDVTDIPGYPEARGWRVQCENPFNQGLDIDLEIKKEDKDFGNGTIRLTLNGLAPGGEYHCVASSLVTNGTGWTDSFFIQTQSRETFECQGPDCPSVCITCKADVLNITDTTAIVLLDVTDIPGYPEARGWRVQCEDTFTQGFDIDLEINKKDTNFSNGTIRLTLDGLAPGREYRCVASSLVANGTGWTDSFPIRTQPRSVWRTSSANSLLLNEYRLTWTAPQTHGWRILTYHLHLVFFFVFVFLFD